MSDYALHEPIGHGGMGVVYAAVERLPNGTAQPVACKVLKRAWRTHDKLVELFQQEAETNRRISHDHGGLVTLHLWFHDSEGHDFLIMELIEGGSLDDLRKTGERLSFDAIRLVARDALDALAYVHGHGIVHRDISPSNVLISRQGIVKLSDFGLAKEPTFEPHGREHVSEFRGKPHYVAPEVITGQGADARSDLFSFAAMLYEMLCGDTPFGSESTAVRLRAMLDESWHIPALPDDVPDDLRSLTMGLLRRHPHERDPQTAIQAREMVREPLDVDATRSELAHVFNGIYQRHNEARTMRERGSLTGIRINAMHLTDGTIHDGSASTDKKRHTRHGSRGALRQTATAVIAAAALGGLILGVYGFQARGVVRVMPQESSSTAEGDAHDEAMDDARALREAPIERTEHIESHALSKQSELPANPKEPPPVSPPAKQPDTNVAMFGTRQNLHTTEARPRHEQGDKTERLERTDLSHKPPAQAPQRDPFSEFKFNGTGQLTP